jgi:hypothetical protein
VEAEIISKIRSHKLKNSTGYDEIPNRILRHCAFEIRKPHSYIHNSSLSSGIYPEKLVHSLVKPIHKKCDKIKMTNYKTISLVLTFSKVFKL